VILPSEYQRRREMIIYQLSFSDFCTHLQLLTLGDAATWHLCKERGKADAAFPFACSELLDTVLLGKHLELFLISAEQFVCKVLAVIWMGAAEDKGRDVCLWATAVDATLTISSAHLCSLGCTFILLETGRWYCSDLPLSCGCSGSMVSLL
jgi:hypothetical protein